MRRNSQAAQKAKGKLFETRCRPISYKVNVDEAHDSSHEKVELDNASSSDTTVLEMKISDGFKKQEEISRSCKIDHLQDYN